MEALKEDTWCLYLWMRHRAVPYKGKEYSAVIVNQLWRTSCAKSTVNRSPGRYRNLVLTKSGGDLGFLGNAKCHHAHI